MRVTKKQAAIFQLCDAIELFKKHRYISAITLAGAAEEILAELLKKHSKKTGVPAFSAEELEAGLFDMFSDFLGIRNYHTYRHKLKNELKHHGGEKNKDVLKGDFRQFALNHIAGAIKNYKFVHNRLPDEKLIIDFCHEIGIS